MLGESDAIDVVGVASDAPEGMARFTSDRPNAVILDIRMPGGSGIEVLEWIRRHDPSCLVIMLTSYAFPELRQRCLEIGANFFLDKATEIETAVDLLLDAHAAGAA